MTGSHPTPLLEAFALDKVEWLEGESRLLSTLTRMSETGAAPATRLHGGTHRFLAELALPAPVSRRLVLKRFDPRHGVDRLRARTPARPAAREWRALQALHAAGLPVPLPLALGRLPGGRDLLVTEFVGRTALVDALAQASRGEQDALLDTLAHVLARLHATGWAHGDLHLGNLRASGTEIHLLDWQRAHPRAGRRPQRADLARLLHGLERSGPGPDWARRFAARLPADPGRDAARRRFLADHQRGRRRKGLRVGDDDEARWQGLADAADGAVRGRGDRGLPPDALLDALGSTPAEEVLAPRRSGRVQIEALSCAGRACIRKRVRAGGLRRALADRLRGSSGARAFRRGQRDRLISDRSAPALAHLDQFDRGLPVESTLLLERVGETDLDAFRPESQDEARRVALALADWLADQHALGLGHRDAKGGNVRLAVGADTPRFWWVDLEDLTGPRRLSERARVHMLVQLNASIADAQCPRALRLEALARYAARVPFARPLAEVAATIHTGSLARGHRYRGRFEEHDTRDGAAETLSVATRGAKP